MKTISNRKAYFEFEILEEYEAGLVLVGSEVKSIKNGDASISSDSFIYLKDGEVFIKNMKVAKYKQTYSTQHHDENRDKKLLLNRKEINKIERLIQDRGNTIVPLKLFTLHNRVKLKMAVVRGKKLHDKKQTIKARDAKRDTDRELSSR